MYKFRSNALSALAECAAMVGALMGYKDAQQLFSDAQALTATAVSTNIIDLGADRNIGVGKPIGIVITVGAALAGTSPTFQVTVQASPSSAFGAPVTVTTGPTYSAVTLGQQLVILLPADTLTDRFIRLSYTLGGTTPTITVTSYLAPWDQIPAPQQYAAGITINN